ncbi:MAG: DUF5687 family protein, partial [Hymenobacteraceae bacterium]|nr:DUF5687 family protein [Hymenobacteraceae bacterium]MDX5395127.1 DUF5687 family protein [Hymenobacteraceae bacterium]MDX5511165.1 DUF5687 family protein [Hymenobacteraceae bacterium]
MIGWLITQQWREATRSSVWQKNLVINIILGLLMLYLLLNFLVLGFFADKIILKIFPNDDVVWRFSSLFGYYLLIDIGLRFLLQELPVLAIQPYLHLPVRKKRLMHFLLGKSLFSFFNLMPLIVLLPFTFKAVVPQQGSGLAVIWLLSLYTLVLFNNYLVVYLKRQLTRKPITVLIFGAALALLFALDFYKVFSFSGAFAAAATQLFVWPWLMVVPLILLFGMYQLNLRLMLKGIYYNELEGQQKHVKTSDLAFLNRFGEVGSLVGLELKLIWRNKRPRTLAFMSLFFLIYGFFIFGTVEDKGYGFGLLAGLMMTGAFLLNYGQYLYSWESSYFDRILTQNISSYQYVQSKFYLLTGSCLLLFILSLPFGFLSVEVLAINTVMFFFNVGVNAILFMYFLTFSPKPIDLKKGA